ncbi:unnamed protein product [Ilex paraguariensis]|uniref:Zinc finger A20 and AN1 domain-containing stress-associated protein 5 n=1 Tax=Ilex paraguariensis TaxID=185542 RepID=A0ABC8R7P0_9AQUA
MAQKTGKEETEFKVVPETLTLCVNNCGLTGNPATNNMCQKCFISTTVTTSSSAAAVAPATLKFSEKNRRSSPSDSSARSSELSGTNTDQTTPDREEEEANTLLLAKKAVNRCSGCRRRVGLTGFRCRCGELFCSEHRYSDRHDCNYDYKTVGRDRIARENPVVKAAKIVKV